MYMMKKKQERMVGMNNQEEEPNQWCSKDYKRKKGRRMNTMRKKQERKKIKIETGNEQEDVTGNRKTDTSSS